MLQPDRVVETLNIRSGMNILDIGAGSGLFSFLFADALNGTGNAGNIRLNIYTELFTGSFLNSKDKRYSA